MARILLISDSPNINTGYGVASHNLGKQLRRLGHDVAFIGFTVAGSPTYHRLDGEDVPLYGGNTTIAMEKAFLEWRPDVAIHIRDAFAHSARWYTHPYSIVSIPNRPKIVLWTPAQADDLPNEFVNACINECDFCVTFTQWGSDVLLFQGVPFNRMSSIWLGFDSEVFKPMEVDREEYGFTPGGRLIGAVGISDQYRKGWPILLRAASFVKKKIPDLDIYLGTSPEGHYSLTHHAERCGMKGSVIYPQKYDKTWGLSPQDLAAVYNCLNAYTTTTIAEGFNLPMLEAFACGIPIVCTDLPNHREILGNDNAFFISSRQEYPTAWGFEWICDVKDAALQIEQALNLSSEGRKELRARQLERSKELTWQRCAERWQELFKQRKELGVKL